MSSFNFYRFLKIRKTESNRDQSSFTFIEMIIKIKMRFIEILKKFRENLRDFPGILFKIPDKRFKKT